MNRVYGWWISPNGDVYPIFNELGHRNFIETYFHKKYETDDDVYKDTIDIGWIRIVNKREFIVNYNYICTKKQLNVLKRFEKDYMEDIFPNVYYLEYNHNYYVMNSWNELVRKIEDRM